MRITMTMSGVFPFMRIAYHYLCLYAGHGMINDHVTECWCYFEIDQILQGSPLLQARVVAIVLSHKRFFLSMLSEQE